LDVVYKREQGHNYLLFEGNGDSIQAQMIRHNHIPGLYDFHGEWEDNRWYYGYDITGTQPWIRHLEIRGLKQEELEGLMENLSDILQKLDQFLICRDGLILSVEYLYYDQKKEAFRFCYSDGQDGEFSDHLREMLLKLLEWIDEEKEELIRIWFRLYRACIGTIPTPERLLSCLYDPVLKEHIPEEMVERVSLGEISKPNGFRKRWREKIFGRKREEEMWDDLEEGKMCLPNKALTETIPPTEILYTEEEEKMQPKLIDRQRGETQTLKIFPFYIGTQKGTHYNPQFQGVSRLHLKIDEREGHFWIMDLNSTNGTKLNELWLLPNEEKELYHGDCIWIGGREYEFINLTLE